MAQKKQYLPVREVAQRYCVSISTIWEWTREGLFPMPKKLGQRCTRWDVDDLDDHDKKAA